MIRTLNELQTRIMHAAHLAAQTVIENNLKDWELLNPRSAETRWSSQAQKREKILSMLAEEGYGRFLLEKSDYGISVAPYSYTETKRDCDGGWHARAKYSVAEVAAYLQARGLQDLTSPLEFICETCDCEPSYSGPGRAFNSGWQHHLSVSGKRIIGDYSAGYDV